MARPKIKTQRKTKTKTKTPTLAEQSDKHHLYQLGVQSPHADVALLRRVYRQARGASPTHLREDFCGTAALLCTWLEQGAKYTGEGVDNDPEPLEWGRRHNFQPLGKRRRRAQLRLADARAPSERAPDIRCAFNFSYWIFRERNVLLDYFRAVRADLATGGVFVIDLHGGAEAFSEEEQVIDCGDFEFVCHQTGVRPVDHRADLALHFRFPDGSEIRNAFRYTWRIWSLPEITDILLDAGFTDIRCHWCIDEKDETRYKLTRTGYNDPAWIACLAALK